MQWPLLDHRLVEERLYQTRIAEEAIDRNTLVVLPTALGKTIIAAYVVSHFLYSYRDRKVLVMAPTKPLVNQHGQSLTGLMKLRKGEAVILTGEVEPSARMKKWKNSRLIFATPQVVRNDLKNGRSTLRDFSLLVFDECHRARKNYAYVEIANRYMYDSPWPIILGTTASPGSTEEKIREICKALYIERIEYRSEEDLDVAPYINAVEVEWRYTKLPTDYLAMDALLKEMLEGRIRWLLSYRLLKKSLRYVSRKDLLELGDRLRDQLRSTERKGMIYRAIIVQSACLTIYHALDLLQTQGLYPLKAFLRKVEEGAHDKRSYREVVEDERYKTFKDLVWRCIEEHPKLLILIEEVKRQLTTKDSKVLVFTQYRDTAKQIVVYLREHGVSAERFVGQATKPDDPGLSQEKQAEVLERFRSGDLEVVVATSVAEEGLDIPTVDLVVFYEPVPSAIRHIQRKGRTGRKRVGRAVILASENTLDEAYVHAARRRVETMRRVTKNLNAQLEETPRRGQIPKMSPLRPEQIPIYAEPLRPIEDLVEAEKVEEIEPMLHEEKEMSKAFKRSVERIARRLIYPILRGGPAGVAVEDLIEECEELGFEPAITFAAIQELERKKKIYRPTWDRVAPVEAKDERRGRTYTLEVEKILRGGAVVWVNDRFRARLNAYDFSGPRDIIKQGSRFKVDAKLYKLNETLNIKVHKVIKLEN